MGSSQESTRWLFIDAWRGIAALMVALVHFYGIVSVAPDALAPGPLDWLLRNGDSGVEIFFVLSGVVVTHNVLQAGRLKASFLPRFALRRSIRLDPPYWIIIGLNLLAAAVVRSNTYDGVGPATVAGNMVYLDNLLGLKSIVAVGWTLCLEIQFYLLVVVLLLCAQSLGDSLGRPTTARLAVFVPVWGLSLAIGVGAISNPVPGLFLSHWYLFCVGVAIAMLIDRRSGVGYALVAVVAAGAIAGAVMQRDASNLFAVIAAGSIVWAVREQRLGWAMGGRALQYLGRISYSLYLVHPLIGNRGLRFLLKYQPLDSMSAPVRWLLVAGALLASIVAAHLLWRVIERPAQLLSRRVSLRSASLAPARAAPGAAT